jgi:uncharacterized repeat protein (TIGR01451 family)
LNNRGVQYDLWDTGNSDNEPDFGFMSAYQLIIWFTGDEFGGFAGPGGPAEAALGQFLDSGKCVFISSQDYHYDRGMTPFMTNYLGAATIADDSGTYSGVTGQGSIFGGLGPYNLTYPFTDFSDIINPNGTAELAFDGNNGNDAGIDKGTAVYQSFFLAFPWEAINTVTGREEVMQAVINQCVSAVGVLETTPGLIEDTVIIGGVATNSLTINNTGGAPFDFTAVPADPWATVNPNNGTVNPGSSLTVDVIFDSNVAGSPGTYVSTLDFTGTFNNTPIPVDLILHVLPQGLGLEVSKSPDTQTVPNGGDANFTIGITNSSVVTINTVTLTDPLVADCDSVVTDLAPGSSTSYTCTDVGVTSTYTNTIIAVGNITGGPSATVTDTAVVVLGQPTDVSLSNLGGSNMLFSIGWVLAVVGLVISVGWVILSRRKAQNI